MANNLKNITRVVLLVVSAQSIWACTNSLVLGTAYNTATNRSADRVKSYADFDAAQRQWIDQSFQSFQQWHRISELPAYSALMNEITATLQSNQTITKIQITHWIDTILDHGQRTRECSPLSGSANFLSEMPNWQIQQLSKKLKSNRSEQYEKYKKETTLERRERRLDMMITWSGRAGLKLTKDQQQLLEKTLAQQTSMGDRRFQLWNEWTNQFLTLLENRDSKQFPTRLRSHVNKLWNMTERSYPAEWQQNSNLWQNFARALLNDLSIAQKNSLIAKISAVSKSTNTLSNKKSSAQPICFNE